MTKTLIGDTAIWPTVLIKAKFKPQNISGFFVVLCPQRVQDMGPRQNLLSTFIDVPENHWQAIKSTNDVKHVPVLTDWSGNNQLIYISLVFSLVRVLKS